MIRIGWVSPLFYEPSGLRNCDIAFSGVTPIAVDRGPGDAAVMTLSAEVAFDDFDHIDIVGSLSHLENRGMTDLAFESDSMKPVGENDGRHSGLLGVVVQGDVAVFGLGNRRNVESEEKSDNQDRQEETNH